MSRPLWSVPSGKKSPLGPWAQIFWNGAIAWLGSCSGRIGREDRHRHPEQQERGTDHADRAFAQQPERRRESSPACEGAAGVWVAAVLAMAQLNLMRGLSSV